MSLVGDLGRGLKVGERCLDKMVAGMDEWEVGGVGGLMYVWMDIWMVCMDVCIM